MTIRLAEQAVQGKMATGILPDLLQMGLDEPDPKAWWSLALPLLLSRAGLSYAAVLHGTKGHWRIQQQSGRAPQALPFEWLADVLDSEAPAELNPWRAAPLSLPAGEGYLLLIAGNLELRELSALAAALGLNQYVLGETASQTRRAQRLRAMLDVTVNWNQNRNTSQLLHQIAETSTRLLDAERATIFLVDETRNLLVGKPALGVAAGELLIPLDAGVVGRVIASGETQRVDSDVASEQAMVHRQVDQKLNFKTRSLICAPMRNANQKIIGAFELINKRDGNFTDEDEVDLRELAGHAAVAIDNTRHVERLVESNKQVTDQAAGRVQIIGQSPALEKTKATAARVADTDLNLLITGENGTGKEVIAQMIHYMSNRRDQVLVAVNCAAITESLLESELFGHEKGAFTDAIQSRKGKFELAASGTLLLDEIGDMSLSGQAKLLRVLEEKVVVRVGGSTPIPTNARVIAATNQNLAQLVREKKFREDLFFRLNVVVIEMPPLRERGRDIILLAEFFLQMFATKVRRKAPELTAAAQKRLLNHNWPGNVRELRNMMERIAYLSTEQRIDANDLPFLASTRSDQTAGIPDNLTLAEATDRFQREYIDRHIGHAHGNMTEAAAQLGLHRSNLYRKINQLDSETNQGPPP